MNLSSPKLFRKISPIFEQLSKAHSSISFVKIDIDDFPVISSKYGVKNIPTFCFISEGKTSFEVLPDHVISHYRFNPPVTFLFPPPSPSSYFAVYWSCWISIGRWRQEVGEVRSHVADVMIVLSSVIDLYNPKGHMYCRHLIQLRFDFVFSYFCSQRYFSFYFFHVCSVLLFT